MNTPFGLGLALLIAVIACAADQGRVHAPPSEGDEPADPQGDLGKLPEAHYDDPFTLAFGSQVRVEHSATLARFAELLEDSRCPPQVRCVQAGRVRVRLEVTRGSAAPESIELGSDRDSVMRSAGGVTWELQALDPPPASGRERRPEDAVLTLVIHPLR